MNIEHVGQGLNFLIFCDVIQNVLLKPESLKEMYLMTHDLDHMHHMKRWLL